MQPLVSVVIATRGNRPEMLGEAIDAVIAQTYEGPIECVIVFDQTEPDLALVSDDERRRVRVTTNSERKPGLAGGRNTGILAATGDYIAFCDDDDVWLPTKLAKQIAAMGDAITSATGIIIKYADSQVTRVPNAATFTVENLIRKRLMEAHPSSVLMRRDALLEKIGLVDEALPGSYAEDYDYIIRALQAGPISLVEEPLVEVRWGQSLFSRDWDTIIAAMDYMVEKHPGFRQDRQAMALIYGRRAFAHAAQGRTRQAWRDNWLAFKSWPLEKRIYVNLLAITRIVPASKVMDIAHRRGRGI